MIIDYTECSLALQCDAYNPDNPCEKPSHRFMRKPVCYTPKERGLISRLAKGVMKKLIKIDMSTTGRRLEE